MINQSNPSLFTGMNVPLSVIAWSILGKNEALLVQQVHFVVTTNEKNRIMRWKKEGFQWFPATVANLYKVFNGNLSESTIKTTLNRLEKQGILVSGVFNKSKWDRAKWYRIDYSALELALKSAPKSEVFELFS